MAITVSILTGGTNSHQTTSEEVNYDKTDFFSNGVVGALTNTSGVAPATGGLAVNAQGTPDMTVAVSAGIAIVTATPASGNSQKLRFKNSATSNVTIAANASGGTRFDWIYAKIDPTAAANPASAATDVGTLVASRSTSATTDNGTPPTYGTLLAIVTVANGASSISNGNIADKRIRANEVGGINDDNGNEILKISSTASAVNEVTLTNAATGNNPQVSATGDDANIALKLAGKGTGGVLPEASGCELTHSTTQSISGSTIQAVIFDTEAFDTAAYHSTVSNTSRITVPVAGKYLFTANVTFATNGTGLRFTWLAKNGTTSNRYGLSSEAAVAGDTTSQTTSRVFNLAASDYIEVYVFQSSGGALNVNGDSTAVGSTGFTCVRIGS